MDELFKDPDKGPGWVNILFVGNTSALPANIVSFERNAYGMITILHGDDGSVYNWANVIRVTPARGPRRWQMP